LAFIIASLLVLTALILAAIGVFVSADHGTLVHVFPFRLCLSSGPRQISLDFGKRLLRELKQVRSSIIISTVLGDIFLSGFNHLLSMEEWLEFTIGKHLPSY
jgi:hypothetical protein